MVPSLGAPVVYYSEFFCSFDKVSPNVLYVLILFEVKYSLTLVLTKGFLGFTAPRILSGFSFLTKLVVCKVFSSEVVALVSSDVGADIPLLRLICLLWTDIPDTFCRL